ncbi:MAG: hypothetical protein AAF585_17165 [Verrucomicrobiota bacterium]
MAYPEPNPQSSDGFRTLLGIACWFVPLVAFIATTLNWAEYSGDPMLTRGFFVSAAAGILLSILVVVARGNLRHVVVGAALSVLNIWVGAVLANAY